MCSKKWEEKKNQQENSFFHSDVILFPSFKIQRNNTSFVYIVFKQDLSAH